MTWRNELAKNHMKLYNGLRVRQLASASGRKIKKALGGKLEDRRPEPVRICSVQPLFNREPVTYYHIYEEKMI